MKQMTLVATMALLLLAGTSCTKSIKTDSADPNATVPRAAVPQSAFNLWGTCNGTPYNISGSNGICIPVGNCSTDFDAAQQSTGQNATGMQFYGCFKGGTSANSSASEQAVFVCDNVSEWNGNEMGFVKTLNDNVLKAYLQGGGQYIYETISSGDNGYHTFKCQARSSNHHQVDFYVDGTYKLTLTNNSGTYYNNWFYFVGTNHWYGGSNNSGQQIEMYSMTTY
ncbi:hypothetical protein GA0116948_110173 [Chitinophaga costaii]|uniref:Alginate lyase n=1 Tax=Chitinophaga costaii TaxID=1335309 RepID=A0A1C4F0I4_9BACT|nr:hypothetical protein [Chitinophaga costaii]PUZ21496.1 hypothetical protein DCM91_15780 [Chitinophaga costaii]SCC49223.1 hypothetical protein GA0116948_110173 [Chitinophaga costaii]